MTELYGNVLIRSQYLSEMVLFHLKFHQLAVRLLDHSPARSGCTIPSTSKAKLQSTDHVNGNIVTFDELKRRGMPGTLHYNWFQIITGFTLHYNWFQFLILGRQ